MSELNNIAADLSKGKNVELNLSKYASGLTSQYARMGNVKLALNLFSFAEVYGEDILYTDIVTPAAKKIANAIKNGILSGDENATKAAIDDIDVLRNELTANMEVLTAYADRLQIIEYVLNRIEYNFNECDIDLSHYEDGFENDIIKYIVSDKDNSVVNMKIGQTVAQLPMRLSKNKFFELLEQGFSIYKGSDAKAVDDFAYMLRSVAMLNTPAGFESEFVQLNDNLNELLSYDYNNMSKDDFEKASDCLSEASENVTSLTDMYVLVMETINSLYTSLLAKDVALVDAKEYEHCINIINCGLEAIVKKELPSEECFADFVAIEGVLEKLTTIISKTSYALDDVKNSIMDKVVSLGLNEEYNNLFKLELLNSGSNFMSLETVAADNVIADEKYIENTYNALREDLSTAFANKPRCINRAIMASILSQLPVFFNNLDEIKAYIHVALIQCKDDAEKLACMKIMQSLMSE